MSYHYWVELSSGKKLTFKYDSEKNGEQTIADVKLEVMSSDYPDIYNAFEKSSIITHTRFVVRMQILADSVPLRTCEPLFAQSHHTGTLVIRGHLGKVTKATSALVAAYLDPNTHLHKLPPEMICEIASHLGVKSQYILNCIEEFMNFKLKSRPPETPSSRNQHFSRSPEMLSSRNQYFSRSPKTPSSRNQNSSCRIS